MNKLKYLVRLNRVIEMKTKKYTKLYEWQERCKAGTEVCAQCGDNRNLTIDHIVPQSILKQLDVDDYYMSYEMEENFQFLCRYCNQQKSFRFDLKNPKTYKILIENLEKCREFYLK